MADITQLYTEFKSDIEKREFITAQHSTITQLMVKNSQLEAEILHLKEFVGSAVPLITKVVVSAEELLVEDQIKHLQIKSNQEGELDLNDVKKLDILVKCKKLIHGEPSDLDGSAKPAKKDLATLLAIVDQHGPK